MSSIAVPSARRASLGPRSRLAIVAAASAASAAVFLLLRRDIPLPYPAFQGACERLRESGIPITSADWFCLPAPGTSHLAYATASLFVAAGFALACAVLAATGRRVTALLPIAVAPVMTYPALLYANPAHWWEGASWPNGKIVGAAFALFLVATPAAVVAIRLPRYAPRRPRVSLAGGAAAAIGCAIAVLPLAYLTDRMFERHFAAIGRVDSLQLQLLWPALAIGLFGSLLGPDRRWWPWSLVAVALLLSMGPSLAVVIGPEGLMDWSMFGAVLPLFCVGLIGSAWRPLAARLTALFAPDRRADAPAGAPSMRASVDRRALRPVAVLNGFAIAALVASLIAFRADPLPVQLETTLPTYLGQRVAVQDVRVKMNLLMAIEAMGEYRAASGSYRGFDAKVGSEVQPKLAWTDEPEVATTPLWTWIVPAGGAIARVAATSESGNAFCLERTPRGLSYGMAEGSLSQTPTIALLRVAITACATTTWSTAAVQTPPFETMCDGLDPVGGYLICRMVQVQNQETLRRLKPAGA